MNRVLVIDDEKSILEMLQIGLARFGCSVETASGGYEGLRLFEKDLFDVVITDIHMPDMDGFNVARHIRNCKRSDTPIIGISGMLRDLECDEFDYVFAKPFKIQSLVHAIKEVVMRKRLHGGQDNAS